MNEMRLNSFWGTFFWAIVVFVGVQPAVAQIEVSSGVWTGQTSYAQSGNDPVFCFLPTVDISLTYQVPGGTGDYNFSWYRHQPSGNTWDIPVASNTGTSSTVSGLIAGGYRVVATDNLGSVVGEARCWAFSPVLNEPEMEMTYDDCFGVDLQASTDSLTLTYYDPGNGVPGYLPYQRVFTWSTLPAQEEPRNGSVVSLEPPYEDVTIQLVVTDRFGNAVEASMDYMAIAVKASFESTVMKPEVLNERHTEINGSAPLEVHFSDTSEGYVSAWEWTFGTNGRAAEANPFFVFTEVGQQDVVLRVVNRNSGCEDTSESLEVNISESELDVPNVFSPNGDGVNDEFRVAYRSLKKFEMVVFNRWGRKVFESSDPAEGWDGTIGNTLAAPGVYFYYIRGEGFNADEVHELKGPIHLIRGKN